MADAGATHVALVVSWEQADVRASAIARSPRVTVPDAQLRAALRRAARLGLRAIVFPVLSVRALRDGEWRGALRPRDVDAWWLAHERFILHYAAIAEAEGAAGLVIGSELGFSEGWRDRWFHLISRVERVYRGELIYSANWDHFQSVSFAARLDHLGVSAYFPLATDGEADQGELDRSWRRHRDALVGFARAQKVSLWLTEVGYPSRDGAAAHPWDYGADGAVDLAEQYRCFAALVAAWNGERALDGLLVWNWWGEGGPRDRDYTPRGKPAATLLRAWFKGH